MKIVHIGKYYPPIPGGIESVVRDVAVEQVRQGHGVWVLSHWNRPGRGMVRELREGVNLLRIPIMGTVAYTTLAPKFPGVLDRVIRTVQPDVIHVHMPNMAPFWLLKKKHKAPIVIHWHSDVLTSCKDLPLVCLYPGYALFERWLLARAAAIIPTSGEYLKRSFALRAVKKKCTVVPLALDPSRMTSFGDASDHGQPLIVSAGRFTYYKGFDVLLRAASLLPSQVRVVIAGDGQLRPKLLNEVERRGLGDKVSLPGRISDQELHAFMAKSTVFCLPSTDRTEAFGMVLLEAMYYARPLVSTRVAGSGMQEVNKHGINGLQVDPGDETSLAQAIEFFLNNPDEARKMGERGKKRVENEFHITTMVRQLSDVYSQL